MDTLAMILIIKERLLANVAIGICDVILFGSRTKINKTKADYDLVVVTNKKCNWQNKELILNELYDIEVEFDILTDLHIISKGEITDSLRGIEPIFQNAFKYGIYA
jgi:predicted nucleotidyltransferase